MAAQDAELKLKVSLDLAFFKTQLAGLGEAAAGYKLPINIKFDRLAIQKELNTLGENIRRRTYRLTVETNLAAEIKNAGTLAKALRGLDNAVQKNKGIANRAAGGQGAGTVDASSFSAMLNRATKPALEALYQGMANAKIPMANVGKGTVDELRRSIMSGVPAITQDIAKGLTSGLDPKLKENGRQGAKFFIDSFKDAAGIASPSKIFKQLGEFSADGLEIGFLDGLKDFKSKAVSEIKKIVALMKLELASVGDVKIGAGIGRIGGGVRGGSQYMSPIGPLPLGSAQPWARGNRGMYGGGGYEPYMATQGFGTGGRGASNIRSVFTSPSILGLGQLALPAAGQTSASISQQARIAQAYARSSERSAAVFNEDIYREGLRKAAGQVPMGGGRFLPPGGGGGGGGRGPGGFDMGGFGRALGSVNLPGANTVRELGTEFAFATKQVLLFGQAYKLLGFAQDLPSQVGNAVGQLQSFRNTLSSITGSAGEAAQANQFILETVDKYNIPLQSARDGFTKLFASMAPAGFSAGEIQDLFLGISKAAATFGMSADKVDRVNYAFAQMASKGQVMSEELKGQLGDVLPGAMGIFAEAAGFKGPDAIQKFGKALEDGAYKGQAMRDLLKNVTIVMNKEFGPGAEGAARTFQGVINRMQNSMQLFYESFEPIAIGFLNTVVVPITSGIKTITDGFTAFFSGTKAKSAGGAAFAEQLKALKPAFDGIQQNIQSILPIFTQFGQVLLQVGKILIQIAGNPIVGYLAKLYLVALPINLIFGRLVTTIGSVYTAMTTLNVGLLAGAQRFRTVDMMMKGFNLTAGQATGILRGVAPALNAVTLGLKAFGSTAVLLGVSLVIERIMSLKGAIDSVRQSTQMMLANISSMANSGAIRELKNLGKDIGKQISTFESLRPYVSGQGGRGMPSKRLTSEAAATMEEIGLGGFIGRDVLGKPYIKDFVEASNIIEERLKSLRKSAASVKEKLPLAERAAADLAKQTKPTETTPITGGGEAGTAKKPKVYISKESSAIQDELNRRLAAVEASTELDARQKEIHKAELTEFAQFAIAKKELDARLLQIDKAGYVNRQQAIDDANAKYIKAINEATRAKEKVLFGPILDGIEKETKAQALATIQQELYGDSLDVNNDLLEAEYTIRTTLESLKGKELQLGKDLAKILRDLIKARVQDADASKYQKKIKEELLVPLQNEIALLRAANAEERRRLEILQKYPDIKKEDLSKVMDLSKVRDNIKAVRELIDNFVNDTSRDYKGFLKAVISGEDAADALQQFQEGLADRVLTIFLDFSMKPVEDFFKDVMGGEIINKLFPQDKLKEGELPKATSTDPATATNQNTNATNTNTTALNALTNALTTQAATTSANNMFGGGFGMDTTGMGNGFSQFLSSQGGFMAGGGSSLAGVSEQLNNISYSAGAATPQLTGLTTSLSGFSFSASQTAIDTGKAAADTAKNSADFAAGLGKAVQGIGIAVSSIMTIAAGIQQIGKGGTKNTLAGIGSILMGLGSGIGGFLKLGKAANGAVWKGGFQAFANGGTVQGPTLGLIGEGKYNEAIVPLPDGRSIPVQMNEPPRSREIMNGGSANATPTLNMSFQTTTINGVEYVSREQLEQAMLETRRLSVKEGSAKGASLALDKLQQSPSARRRVGI